MRPHRAPPFRWGRRDQGLSRKSCCAPRGTPGLHPSSWQHAPPEPREQVWCGRRRGGQLRCLQSGHMAPVCALACGRVHTCAHVLDALVYVSLCMWHTCVDVFGGACAPVSHCVRGTCVWVHMLVCVSACVRGVYV